MTSINYNTGDFPFKDLVRSALNTESLAFIHEQEGFIYLNKFERKNDQSTHFHKLFYDFARTPEFTILYLEFIKSVVKPLFGEEVVFQKIPTIRLHFPGNIAVGEFHRDRDYRDLEWAKRVNELNFFLPITDAFRTNTIWAESKEGEEDFGPINAEYGQIVMWDGSNLLHGNKINVEAYTRVSFDFRVMPLSRYEPSEKGSINMNSKFGLDGYYDKI
jgi:hypothetical protein